MVSLAAIMPVKIGIKPWHFHQVLQLGIRKSLSQMRQRRDINAAAFNRNVLVLNSCNKGKNLIVKCYFAGQFHIENMASHAAVATPFIDLLERHAHFSGRHCAGAVEQGYW